MVAFRKLFFALAVTGLMLSLSVVASAQPITCNVTGNPLTVRSEGLAELVGDIVLSCTGGTPVAALSSVPQVNISVTLTTNITSKLLIGSSSLTEALLFIDDPQFGAQVPCAGAGAICPSLVSDGAGGSGVAPPAPPAPQVVTPVYNVFQGVRQADNTIVFLGVPINPPGTQTRVFRIKNVRAAISGFSAPNGQVFAFLSIQNPPANLQLNQAQAVVGFVQNGLIFDRRSATGGGFSSSQTVLQCADFNKDVHDDATKNYNSSPGGGRVFQLRYREGYNLAFKPRETAANQADPTFNYNAESGFFNTTFPSTNGLNQAGRADHGTRLLARFANVPSNVKIFVSAHPLGSAAFTGTTSVSGGGETSSMLQAFGVAANSNGANTTLGTLLVNAPSKAETTPAPNASTGTPGLIEVPLVGGAGSFTWEVFAADQTGQDTASFAVSYALKSANNPGTGTPTVNGSLAPISTVNKMDGLAPVPRFADGVTSPANAVPIVSCVTNLLYPFVTNQAGFDTGLVISNTSRDPFGTAPQSGNCKINYYGSTAGGGAEPPPQTTTSPVTAGGQAVWLLSAGGTNGLTATPGFQGYIIAQCDFRYAHGFAFISDVGAQRLAQGYLALVMDESSGTRTKASSETLGQ